MSQRVILGNYDGNVGMWISAPGKDASSTVFEDLLVDTTRINMQPIMKGVISGISMPQTASSSPFVIYISGLPFNESGWMNWGLTITHGLGYVPLCHLSILNYEPGTDSPQVYITSTTLTLFYSQVWTNSGLGIPNSMPNPISFNADFHWTLFRQAAV
jgi:hypothetical protein